MPGGQSASALGASLVVFERSTGTSTSILGAGFGLLWTGLAEGVGCLAGADGLLEDFRMLSIEKLRFFVVVEAGEPGFHERWWKLSC